MEMEEHTFTGKLTDETWIVKPTTLPKVVGGYRMGKHTTDYIQFNMYHKPIWFHRQMMRIFFGWYWFDDTNVK